MIRVPLSVFSLPPLPYLYHFPFFNIPFSLLVLNNLCSHDAQLLPSLGWQVDQPDLKLKEDACWSLPMLSETESEPTIQVHEVYPWYSPSSSSSFSFSYSFTCMGSYIDNGLISKLMKTRGSTVFAIIYLTVFHFI